MQTNSIHRWPLKALCVSYICLASTAFAQQKPGMLQGDYPNKAIRMITGGAPGGSTDGVIRGFAQRLGERWGQPVVTENHTGPGGIIAVDYVVKASPDGYTFLVIGNGAAINAALVAKRPYDMRTAFVPVTQLTAQQYMLLVNPSLPVKSVKELIALARSKPGALNYSSSGIGSIAHIGTELFKYMAHVDMLHVPYKASTTMAMDLITGRIEVAFSSTIFSIPNVKAGKLRALAVGGLRRLAILPDLPTVSEAALPGFELVGWYGVFAPAGTPPAIVTALSQEVGQILKLPDLQDKIAADGAEAAPNSPAEFKSVVEKELSKWGKLFKDINLQL